MLQDLRFGARTLAKSPGFTAIAVMTLALGVGANITIFSIINTILLKPVRVRHPEQIVSLYQRDRDEAGEFRFFSYPDFADLRSAKDGVFTDLFAIGIDSAGLQGDVTEKLQARLVTANYFSALGVPPALGRGFLPEEETSGAAVAVLSHDFWRRLGADPSLVGRVLKLTRGDVTVVGVMPPGFTGSQLIGPAVYFPLGMADALASNPGQPAARTLSDRGNRRFMLTGRLKPNLTLANLEAPLAVLGRQFAVPDPKEPKPRTLVCLPPARFNFSNQPEQTGKNLVPLAALAFGLSVLVLCVACLNLANMMLARGAARRKEIAVRLALGAGPRRILSQLLTEGLLLALGGGACGLLVSVWAANILAAFIYSGSGMPSDFPRFDLSPDGRTLGTLLLVSGLTVLVFALGPAWQLARLDVNSDLKRGSGDNARRLRPGRLGTRDLLAMGQMALALGLLAAASLFTRSAANVFQANPGFEFGANFYLALDPGLNGYPQPRLRELIRSAVDRLSALPGVAGVSPAMNIPFGDSDSYRGVQLAGAPPPSDAARTLADGKAVNAAYNVVGADYFRVLGLALRQGREFDRHEAEDSRSPHVAVISQNLADQLWPGQNPVGRPVQFPSEAKGGSPDVMTVVGVVPAIDWTVFEKEQQAGVYVPLAQDFQASLKLHVRVAPGVDPVKLMAAARQEMRRLDPRIPLSEVRTLAAMHHDGPTVKVARLGSMLFGAFGGLALILSFLGVYGLKAYSVSRRTREIGIRMALGATRAGVLAMIARESSWLAGLGLGLGLLLAAGMGKLVGPYLCRVQPMDPPTFIAIPLVLLAATLAGCLLPARRAAKLNPMAALRAE